MSSEKVNKLSKFYATLDLKCELPERTTSEGLTPFLKEQFKSEDKFWKYVDSLQKLKNKYRSEDKLIQKVARMLKTEPLYFLVLTHLHRQMRFTNLELVHFLFDRERLDDASYYLSLTKSDPSFKKRADRRVNSKKWIEYVGEVNLKSSKDNVLASFKKVIASYLGSENKCWKLWKFRIKNDPNVAERIAQFVITNEDLKKLIESDSVKTAMERSLRTVNVEVLKKERGEYGSNRVKDILDSAGFAFLEYKEFSDIEELEQEIKVQSTIFQSKYIYTVEKEWKTEGKTFDFVLISNNKIQFVMEANYYTTGMSKVGEVVKHFMELKKACGEKYRLIYITDGMGWLKLVKKVHDMIEFEIEEQKIKPSPVPFLMNLEMFKQHIGLIKSEMK